jgi:DNA-binding NarL/FixJ family response regulator
MLNKIRVILADDHALVLEGLRGMLEQHDDIEVVAVAHNGDELLAKLTEHTIDVVVLDWQMDYHGSQVLREIRERKIPVHVLILTAFSDGDTLQTALELEADGVALKTESPSQTVNAIRQVAQGSLVFPRAAHKLLLRQESATNNELSSRESEVLALVARGSTNPEIAGELKVSENTVRFHLKNIFEKLNVTNRTEAAAWYFQRKSGR